MAALRLSLILAGAIACTWIAWSDFRTRRVHVIAFVLLLGAGLGLLATRPFYLYETWETLLVNYAFVGLVSGFTWLWFRLRGRAVMDEMLGWGDVAMFVACAPWLEVPVYELFFIGSLVLTLAGALIWKALLRQTHLEIPLAGCMAVLWLGFWPVWNLILGAPFPYKGC